MDDCLQSLLACIHNIVIHYSDRGLETWTAPIRLEMSLQQRSHAREHLAELKYELKKIH